MKKIERPDWDDVLEEDPLSITQEDELNTWFNQFVEPINELLENAVKVYGIPQDNCTFGQDQDNYDTHKALLIDIQPIEKETAEDVLKDFLKHQGNFKNIDLDILATRAKAALEPSDD